MAAAPARSGRTGCPSRTGKAKRLLRHSPRPGSRGRCFSDTMYSTKLSANSHRIFPFDCRGRCPHRPLQLARREFRSAPKCTHIPPRGCIHYLYSCYTGGAFHGGDTVFSGRQYGLRLCLVLRTVLPGAGGFSVGDQGRAGVRQIELYEDHRQGGGERRTGCRIRPVLRRPGFGGRRVSPGPAHRLRRRHGSARARGRHAGRGGTVSRSGAVL